MICTHLHRHDENFADSAIAKFDARHCKSDDCIQSNSITEPAFP